jgi:hypothetical protein
MAEEIGTPVIPGQRDNDGLHKRRGIWHYKLSVGGGGRNVPLIHETTTRPERSTGRRRRLSRRVVCPVTRESGPLRRRQRRGWWHGRVKDSPKTPAGLKGSG